MSARPVAGSRAPLLLRASRAAMRRGLVRGTAASARAPLLLRASRAAMRRGLVRGTAASARPPILLLAACAAAGSPPAAAQQDVVPSAPGSSRPASGTERDWEIVAERLRWARDERLDTLPRFGDVVAAIGRSFVGTPYAPATLEVPGPERLVVNLEALDCVTFVENALALARLARFRRPDLPRDRVQLRAAFKAELARVRYRNGELDGYASRLHYFSEWIADNERKGLVRDLSQELGGAPVAGAVDFMSTHPDAYVQLADPSVLAKVAAVEARLSTVRRHYLPAARIAAAAPSIRNGDVIAATSVVAGLDVAHTGLALWDDGRLKLLHAPLAGSHVQISSGTLAERIRRLGGQDGIMVARPVDPRPSGGLR